MKINVRVISNARKAEVIEEGRFLKVKVNASPVEGRANKRLIEILAEYFSKIIKGWYSRDKVVEVSK